MKKSKQRRLILGARNIRTLQDRENIPRPERRTALISKELARYRIDGEDLKVKTDYMEWALQSDPV
jgi:hypothetical protein